MCGHEVPQSEGSEGDPAAAALGAEWGSSRYAREPVRDRVASYSWETANERRGGARATACLCHSEETVMSTSTRPARPLIATATPAGNTGWTSEFDRVFRLPARLAMRARNRRQRWAC